MHTALPSQIKARLAKRGFILAYSPAHPNMLSCWDETVVRSRSVFYTWAALLCGAYSVEAFESSNIEGYCEGILF